MPSIHPARFYQRKTVRGWVDDQPITLSSLLILEAADKLGVTYKVLPGTKIIECSYQGETKYFRYQISSSTTDVGFYACLDKSVTNNLLEVAGIKVPTGFNLTRNDAADYWREVYEALPKPLVVKPTHGNQGNAITLGIKDYETYQRAVKKAFDFLNEKDAGVIVEETFIGKEYRVLVTREKVIGILHRRPANVEGDGRSTIQELLDQKNADPRRGTDDTYALFKIKVDDEVMSTLRDQGLSLSSVPKKDERIFVRRVSNIAKGGDSIDVTDEAHPSVSEIAVKALRAIPGLDFVGLDFMTQDITRPQSNETYRVIEINSSPGFCIQELPFIGKPRGAAEEFLYLMFPSLRS